MLPRIDHMDTESFRIAATQEQIRALEIIRSSYFHPPIRPPVRLPVRPPARTVTRSAVINRNAAPAITGIDTNP